MIPNKPGLWWRKGHSVPVTVRSGQSMTHSPGEVLVWWGLGNTGEMVEDDGAWIGPCSPPDAVATVFTSLPAYAVGGIWAWVSRGRVRLGSFTSIASQVVFWPAGDDAPVDRLLILDGDRFVCVVGG